MIKRHKKAVTENDINQTSVLGFLICSPVHHIEVPKRHHAKVF